MPATTRTNLGPLTTTFTAPTRCSDVILEPAAPGAGWRAQTCYEGHMTDDAACWPSPAGGVYTPGLVCPDSYTTACSATAGARGGFDFQFGLEAGETAVGCCPSGYGCYRDTASGMLAGTVVQTCTSSATRGSLAAATCSGNGSVASAPPPAADFLIRAPLVQMAWRSSDLAPGPTSSAGAETTSRAPTGTSAAASSAAPPVASSAAAAAASSATAYPAFSADDTPSGLSLGAAVGAGVGAALLVLAVVAAAMCLASRRRRGKDRAGAAGGTPAPGPRPEPKAYRYGPSVEVPGAYGTGYELDDPEWLPGREASAREQARQQPQLEPGRESKSQVAEQPGEEDYLWDLLYEEVRGGWAPERDEDQFRSQDRIEHF